MSEGKGTLFTKGGKGGPGRPKGSSGIDRRARLAALSAAVTDEDWREICEELVRVAKAGPIERSSEWGKAVAFLLQHLLPKPGAELEVEPVDDEKGKGIRLVVREITGDEIEDLRA